MIGRKNLWWQIPATAGILTLITVSGAGNFLYGMAFGGPIFGAASLAFDAVKIVALVGVFMLWRNGRKVAGLALFVLFLGFTAWSMLSAVGFISTRFANLEDTRGKTASEWQSLTSQIERLEERRAKVENVRPQKTIQAEIDGILRIPGIEGCAVINGPVTSQHCPKLDKLKVELGHAESATWLDGRLDELRKELSGTDRVSVVDPRTDTIVAVTTATAASVALGIKIFFAALVEYATACGLWIIWAPSGRRRDVTDKPQEAPKTSPAPSAPPKSKQPVLGQMARREALPEPEPEPVKPPQLVIDNEKPKPTSKPSLKGPVQRWKRECLEPTKVGGCATSAMHESYVEWCRQQGYSHYAISPFGKKLSKLGLAREGKNAGAWRPGWKLKEVAKFDAAAA